MNLAIEYAQIHREVDRIVRGEGGPGCDRRRRAYRLARLALLARLPPLRRQDAAEMAYALGDELVGLKR